MSTGANLIFLVSQPRAGSTMLQKILGAHPRIHTASEPWVALHPLFALRDKGVSAYYSHALAKDATREFAGEQVYIEGVRLFLNHLYDAALAPSGKPIFLDKTPRYYFILSELRRVFPDARFVLLLRNPLAVLASVLEAWVNRPMPGQRSVLRLDLLHDLLTAPELLAQAKAAAGPLDAVVHYENLVRFPEAEVARLCAKLRLPFDPAMIEYGAEPGQRWPFGDQDTVYAETRPVAMRAEGWRATLAATPEWKELAHSYLAALGPPVIRRLGYNFDELADGLGLGGEAPPFLRNATIAPAYGETSDFPNQVTHFQHLLWRAKPLARAALRGAAG